MPRPTKIPQLHVQQEFVLIMNPLRRLSRLVFLVCLAVLPSQAQVVISQVYGGGGNAGATYKNDFIELFNRGTAPVSLTGWSVQYASSAGTTWAATSLSGTLQPGQYYLVQEAAGTGGTTNLPTPDATGSIAMSLSAGKVALVNSTTALSGACPTTGVQDFVGFGSANCFEGAGPTPTLTNTTAALRAGNGCADTNNNAADFSTGAPTPRNTAVAAATCGSGVSITTASPLPTATQSTPYSVTFAASGGTGSGYTFSKTAGTFPPGLMLTGATLAGTPSSAVGSPFSFTIKVTDSGSNAAQKDFQLTVNPASTPPSATGAANPSSLQAGDPVLLTVSVTTGTNPTSTGLAVTSDLSAIGGAASQQFYDDQTHGDITAGDNIFSFATAVSSGITPGAKSLPVTVTDTQSRSGSAAIALTVQPPPSHVKISQVYGGGGNSGATYTNDFVEIFNQGPNPVDLTGWSVQYNSAGTTTGSWQVTSISCPSGTCVVQPGYYFLVQESSGNGGTTSLPTPDFSGGILMGAGRAKVALVPNSTAISGACPALGSYADLVGYGSANCSESSPTATLSNTLAAVRRGNGCTDTDNNRNDFVAIGPIPRNSASPAQSCGGDPTQPAGIGVASPASLDPAANTLLSVKVTPATNPPSTNISVTADLTSIGGNVTQPFYDDGTHGDQTAGDNVFSFLAPVETAIPGVKSIQTTIADEQSRTATAPITITVQSPTCGVERWSVKVGTDPDATQVDMSNPVRAQIADLGAIPPPADPPGPPDTQRVSPEEKTLYVVNATMTLYKKETDVDYHIVLQDEAGHTMVVEVPYPGCILGPGTPRQLAPSPFTPGITAARAAFDAKLTANGGFQSANIPVQIKGIGFFDFIHGQTGVAPNGIELHPVVEINFTSNTTTTVSATPNPSQYGQQVVITATVTVEGGGATPTGAVTLLDAGTPISTANLDASGQAVFTTSNLSVGSHSLTISYEGDSAAAQSSSNASPWLQVVNKADQTIDFGTLSGKTFGDADFTVSATSTSGLPVSFSIVSGPATIAGATVHITGAGQVTVRASQNGDDNYNPAVDVEQSFIVGQAAQAITFAALADKTFGDAPFTVSATGGASTSPVTFAASGNCSSGGLNGSTISLTGAGSCAVTASQAGDTNYQAATDVVRSFSIAKATATIVVNGFNGPYDGEAHGAGGSASGVAGATLTELLDLGATFINVPGGTANWTFAGNDDYKSASGSVAIVINKASASFSNLSSPAIITGATPTTLSGKIALGNLVPTGSVAITLNGVTENAAIQADGSFSSSFATGSLTPTSAGYAISYSYAGDNNFNSANGDGTLTVGFAITPLFDETKSAQSGSTVPIRLQLSNDSGGNVSSASLVLNAVKIVQTSSNASSDVMASGNANPDNNFRFDGSAYIFNLSTKGLATGTYQLQFTVTGDSATHSVSFQVR